MRLATHILEAEGSRRSPAALDPCTTSRAGVRQPRPPGNSTSRRNIG